MADHPQRILVADDDANLRWLVVVALKTIGYQVVQASNGKEALEMILQDPPHLILLDGMMPIMNGYQCIQKIRENPKLANIPVVMLTGLSSGEDEIMNPDVLPDGRLPKPFSITELQQYVQGFLPLHTK